LTLIHRFANAHEAIDPDALSALIGPLETITRTPLTTSGFTGAHHERLDVCLGSGELRRLVIKRVNLNQDWTATRTDDRVGREAALLDAPALAAVWDVFVCPYRAYWAGDDEIGLMMEDLSPFLFPDVREPLSQIQEERLLTALADLHARFWGSPALELPWLARPEHYAGLVDAPSAQGKSDLAQLPNPLREQVQGGWQAALRRLPRSLAALLEQPASEAAREWEQLPRTLLHGDAKVANFALLPETGVAAFDWALIGGGPSTIDLGWYLAVNGSRLARPKELVMARYRALLTSRLTVELPDPLWDSLVRVAVIVGARMGLWAKALALETGLSDAEAEWTWWVERLEAT
jgi:hypothetical protein